MGEKKKKHSGRRKEKKRTCTTGDCQGSIWQNYYMDGGRRNTSRSIGKGWKKIGSDGKGIHSLK